MKKLKHSVCECTLCKKRAASDKKFQERHTDTCSAGKWLGFGWNGSHSVILTDRPAGEKEYRHTIKEKLRRTLIWNGFTVVGSDIFYKTTGRNDITYILRERKFELQNVEHPLREGWSFTFHSYTRKATKHIVTPMR